MASATARAAENLELQLPAIRLDLGGAGLPHRHLEPSQGPRQAQQTPTEEPSFHTLMPPAS